MNRVVLCGRLTGRPRSAYTPAGVAVAHFQLLVSGEPPGEPGLIVSCFALREVAERLLTWGERGHRVNLEGRLHCRSPDPDPSSPTSLQVLTESAYFVDPVMHPQLRATPDGESASPCDPERGA